MKSGRTSGFTALFLLFWNTVLKILDFDPKMTPKRFFPPPFISIWWKIVTDNITDNSPGHLARAVSVCSGCLQENQHAVLRHHDVFLPGGDRRVFELAQRLLDLLFRFHQGCFHCAGLNLYFREVRRKGFASLFCDGEQHRVRLLLYRDLQAYPEQVIHFIHLVSLVLIHAVHISIHRE